MMIPSREKAVEERERVGPKIYMRCDAVPMLIEVKGWCGGDVSER
jgi:hypothetical protein